MFKIYQNFIAALNEKYNCSSECDLEGMNLQHYRFASSTNKRGLDAIGVFEAYGFSMNNLKILDVGCAYGGFSIESAKKGAHCYGVEISQSLYDFACLNNKDEVYNDGSCNFFMLDATSPDFLEKMPHNYFDLIVVNDVFEHVYDTVQLLSNLSKVGNENCAIYFVIPNGNDLRYIAKEGHSGYCGISLLKALYWHTLTGDKTWNIYYRQYDYYVALFKYFGFNEIVPINYPGYIKMPEIQESIELEYEITKKTIKDSEESFPDVYLSQLKEQLNLFDKQLNYDKTNLPAADLSWKYLTKFWGGFAQRKKLNLVPIRQTTEQKVDFDNSDKVNATLSINGKKLSAEIKCDFSIENFEFDFHLSRRGECIEKSCYISEPKYKWNLVSPGMYWVAIYAKQKGHENNDFRVLTQPLYFSGE